MRFFQQSFLPDPLGPILAKARKRAKLSIKEAAKAAGLDPLVAEALEQDRALDPSTARFHAVTYARTLGIEPMDIRDSLPQKPVLVGRDVRYLSRMGRPARSRWHSPLEELHRILAPVGRAALYLLLTVTLLSTWIMVRQLSRVRSIPWITSNSQPTSFSTR
jgi:transcriptional regulator with XRE-family HTH domain